MVTVDASGVCFGYRDRPVLRDVDLACPTGQILAIVGPNGAGKTTLLKCLNRLLVPSAGTIRLNGRDIATMARTELATTLAYVPQHTPAPFPTTVFDAVLLGRRPYLGWRPRRHDLDIVADALHRTGITDFADRDISRLSGGERQKVALAKALAQQPAGLILDEPTASLDLHHQLAVLDVLQSLAHERATTIIMTVHDLNLALRAADRIAVLHHGQLHAAIPPAQFTPAIIRDVWHVDATILHHQAPVVIPLQRL